MTLTRRDTLAAAATAARFARPVSPRQVSPTRCSADRVRKMRSFWSYSLQRQLAIAVALLLVPVLGAALWSGASTFRERADELGDQTRVVAYTTAAYIDRELSYLDGTGANVAANREVQALDPSSEDLLRRITAGHSMIACIDLVERSGDVVVRATMPSVVEPHAPARDWADEVFRTGARFVSPVYLAA